MKKPCNTHKGFVPAIFLCKFSHYCENLEFLGGKFNNFVKKTQFFKTQFLEKQNHPIEIHGLSS
jgi:hypothetical protein